MAQKQLTYEAAMARLEEIVGLLERGDLGVDQMTAIVKEGVELVNLCRARLTTVQTDVAAALSRLDENGKAREGAVETE